MTTQLPSVLSEAIGAMKNVSVSIENNNEDFSYLRLLKSGEWVCGSDDVEVAENSVFAISTESFFAGFQSWSSTGELAGEETHLIVEPPLTRGDLPDVGSEWKPLIGFRMLCVEGDNEGLQLVYKTTAKGGIKAVGTLMKQIVAHVESGESDALIPLIQLDVSSYKHKQWGKIYTPELAIVEWVNEIPSAKLGAEEEEVEPVQEEPVRRRRRRA